MENTEFYFPDVATISKSLDETKADLREYAESKEWWMVVADPLGWVLIQPMIKRHYSESAPGDYIAMVCTLPQITLTVILLRRLRMSARQYRFELSKQSVAITEHELLAGGALLRCAPENEATARQFAREVLDVATKGEQLGMEE